MVGVGVVSELFQRKQTGEDVQELTNWSATHSVTINSKNYHLPTSLEQVESLVKSHHHEKQKLRPVGSSLSPNGIAFDQDGMINLSLMDKILDVDEQGLVTVEAGIRIDALVNGLKQYELTLPNYASIREQQIGGFISVGAHGTGMSIPPGEEFVTALTLVTPQHGTLHLSANDTDEARRELFNFAKLSIGTLGVITSLTLQCIPRHKLREETFLTNHAGVEKWHKDWLREWRHLRYMWIPNTDKVVVVRSNPTTMDVTAPLETGQGLEQLKLYYQNLTGREAMGGYTTLRDELYLLDPTSASHVASVNRQLAKTWMHTLGMTENKDPETPQVRVDYSDAILGFDCGGQQWVSEVAFPIQQHSKSDVSVDYMMDLLQLIETNNIAAHEPLEQRWTAASTAPLSPSRAVSSWVGIISYLRDISNDTSHQRDEITRAFVEYKTACRELWMRYHCLPHWAKIEPGQDADISSYPLERWRELRRYCDPHGILQPCTGLAI